jgi:acetyltransferase
MFAEAQAIGMRIIGPNCLGVIIPGLGLDATFASATALPGSIGFVSQSGALCTAILDWAASRNVGFSYFISAGSMVDVGWADYLDHLVDDPQTKSILLYMESVGDHPSSFVSSARQAASLKPLIVMKSGRTEVAGRAAVSHTGALMGNDDVFDAALRRCGALRVDSIQDLFDMADVLAKGKRPAGKRLAIVTNAGGPGVIAADALIAAGGQLASLAPESRAALDALLPAHWSRANPVDIFGDADPARYSHAVGVALRDPNSDAVLVIYAPQAVANGLEVAESIRGSAAGAKPVLAAWMGGAGVADGISALERAGISTYSYPELAVSAFDYLWRYDENLKALYETPATTGDEAPDHDAAACAIQSAVTAGRTSLTPAECAGLAAAYGIPLIASVEASTGDEAVAAAGDCGYPVAVKVRSNVVTHKTDVGGVRLNVSSPAGVRDAFDSIRESVSARAGAAAFGGVIVQPMAASSDGLELILGCSSDPQFGPVIVFGLGGTLVEVFRDRAIGLPPLNGTLARLLMESTRAFAAFGAVRGRAAVDVDALAALVVRFSRLVTDVPRIREVDLNPLFVGPSRIVALDMRVLLHDPAVATQALPKPAIRPYPSQYSGTWTASDGTPVEIRPIRAEDEPLVREFHRSLSDDTVYMRFAHVERLEGRIAHARLARACFIDYGREIALIAESTAGDHRRVLGIANLVRTRRRGQAEFALLVGDGFQRRGVGTELLRRLVAIGSEERMTEIVGYVLESNAPMLAICKRLGFTEHGRAGDSVVRTTLKLPQGMTAGERV